MTSLTWAFNFNHVIKSDQSIWTSVYNQFFYIHSAVCRCFPHTDLPSAPPALIFTTIICGYTSTALVNTDSQAVLKRKDPLCPWPGLAFSSEQSCSLQHSRGKADLFPGWSWQELVMLLWVGSSFCVSIRHTAGQPICCRKPPSRSKQDLNGNKCSFSILEHNLHVNILL